MLLLMTCEVLPGILLSLGFASPPLEVSVVQAVGSRGGLDFVIFGPRNRQDRFRKFISLEGFEKWKGG